jgi:senataxin
MHPEICDFPSKYFYAQKLFTHPEIALRDKKSRLNPYVVLDISPVLRDGHTRVENESSVMLEICKFLYRTVSRSDVGIIAPDQDKSSFYREMLHLQPFATWFEIHTVDGFKGREKNIVVLSAAQSNGASFITCRKQLNVALTRAKKCLVICANCDELIDQPHWRSLFENAHSRKLLVTLRSPKDTRRILESYMKKY